MRIVKMWSKQMVLKKIAPIDLFDTVLAQTLILWKHLQIAVKQSTLKWGMPVSIFSLNREWTLFFKGTYGTLIKIGLNTLKFDEKYKPTDSRSSTIASKINTSHVNCFATSQHLTVKLLKTTTDCNGSRNHIVLQFPSLPFSTRRAMLIKFFGGKSQTQDLFFLLFFLCVLFI